MTARFKILLIAMSAFCASCWTASFGLKQAPSTPTAPAPTGNGGNQNEDPSHVICNPFGEDRASDPSYGLRGQMRYLEAADTGHGTNLQGYIDFGKLIDANIYMSEVNVPTRAFDRGFSTETQDTLRTSTGEVIDEYFSLQLKSALALATGDAPGDYQLGMITDDGATLSLGKADGTYQEMIKTPGVTGTKFACAMAPVTMSATGQIPLSFDYFQAPRYHLALMIVWRPWPAHPADVEDPQCGVMSTTDWFDPTTVPSTPKANFLDIQSRGWKVLQAGNYRLQSGTNPCAAH